MLPDLGSATNTNNCILSSFALHFKALLCKAASTRCCNCNFFITQLTKYYRNIRGKNKVGVYNKIQSSFFNKVGTLLHDFSAF